MCTELRVEDTQSFFTSQYLNGNEWITALIFGAEVFLFLVFVCNSTKTILKEVFLCLVCFHIQPILDPRLTVFCSTSFPYNVDEVP